MSNSNLARLGAAALAAFALWVAGCNNTSTSTPATSPQAGDASPAGDDHAGHEHDSEETAEQLAKLPPEDRTAAEKQKVCPVTGEPLGSMGVPKKVTVNGREVFLCCEGCEEELNANPDKYLAKLPE